jgi:F-type H+-transporting ATPase subunit a
VSGFVPLETDSDGGYTPPGVEDFVFDGGFIPGVDWVNKPLVQVLVGFAIVLVFWLVASRRLAMVPGKRQFASEFLYNFVRNSIARDIIGHGFQPYIPYLLGLFSFLLVNNLFGLFPLFMFPTFSNIGYAWALALISWIIYNAAGIRRHGATYFKNSLIPAGVPGWLLPIIIPIEALSNFIVRPLTLGLRLFGNLFAGHLVVLVFVVGGTYLLTSSGNWFYNVAGGVSLIFSFAIFGLELLVSTLQAYIFTVLTAQYVASATADEH